MARSSICVVQRMPSWGRSASGLERHKQSISVVAADLDDAAARKLERYGRAGRDQVAGALRQQLDAGAVPPRDGRAPRRDDLGAGEASARPAETEPDQQLLIRDLGGEHGEVRAEAADQREHEYQ